MGGGNLSCRGTKVRQSHQTSLQKAMRARREWNEIFKGLKEKITITIIE
jgi:hypothetical protein